MLDVTDKRSKLGKSQHWLPEPLSEVFTANLDLAARAAAGLWRRDASVWSADPATQKKISNRLGWLDSPMLMAKSIQRLITFANEVR